MPTPAAPANLVASRIGIDHAGTYPNKVALRFTFTNNEAGATHLIQSSTNGTTGWKDLVEAGGGQSTVIKRNLALGAKLFFRIRSEFAGEGTYSAWVNALGTENITGLHTLPKLPTAAVQINAPSDLTVAQNDFRRIVLTWDDNANNESLHILNLTGPGLPAGGLEFGIDHLDSGTYTFPVAFPIASGYQLQHDKTYTAKVKVRGGKQTTIANTFETDWTADVSFTTAAAHVALVNLPAAQEVARGQAFSFRVLTNIEAVLSIVSGALPTGLALVGDTISGTTVAAAGAYAVSILADDGATDDTQTLTLNVRTPLFAFTNLPTNPTAWNTVPFLFRALTNTPAASIDLQSGTLPADLAFAVDAVSGTPDADDGTYPVTLHAVNALGTETAATLAISVKTPSILVLLKPHGTGAAPKSGDAWGEIVAPLGQLFQWDISAQPVGPIAVGSDVTIDGAPAWLTLNETLLVGTPDDSGTSDVVIAWSNGTFSGSTTLRIRVPTIQITSVDHLSVYEDEQFSFALASLPGGIFRVSDPEELPAGVGIQSPSANVYVLAGKTSVVGAHVFQLAAMLGQEQDTQAFTLNVLPLISVIGGEEIGGWKGDPLLQELVYHGTCEVEHWYLSGGPAGVEIAALDCPGGPYEGSKSIVAITGTPTESGIFEAIVTAHVCCDGLPELHRVAVKFKISGGLFLGWFHDDPDRRELQVMLRDREVTDFAMAGSGLFLKRGDDEKLFIIFRDGPLAAGNYGRSIVTDGFDEVRLVVRPREDFDGDPYLELGGADLVFEEVAGFSLLVFAFNVTSKAIEDPFTKRNTSQGAEPIAVQLEGDGEITWLRAGRKVSSRTFPVTIAQDIER